jgi:hypothetical protein
MREGLAREFPEAGRAVAWTRARIGLWSEPAPWAAISGIGAAFLVGAAAQALVGLTQSGADALRGPTPFFAVYALLPLATLAGTAAGAAVALGARGVAALGLYLAYLALGVALAIPGIITFCERSGGGLGLQHPGFCTAAGLLTSLWPQLIGIAVGIASARAIRTRGSGINSLLRVAGAYAVALLAVTALWGTTVAPTTSALPGMLTIAAGAIAAAVAAGAIAARLPRSIRSAVVVAGISLLPWLTQQLPYTLRSLGPEVTEESLGALLVSVAVSPVAAVFLVLSAAVASRSHFIPRDPA